MKMLKALLSENPQVSGYKIDVRQKESCELFFVKGKLETVRHTDTCDKEVTVYACHGSFMGDAQFFVYPSTTEEQIRRDIADAVGKALLIQNPVYTLPEKEVGEYAVHSNFADYELADLAQQIAQAVLDADQVENAALNSVEVFVNKHTESVCNSRGLEKKQVRYSAMIETIPTFNGSEQSVELYHQYNFGQLDIACIQNEVSQKLQEVKARYSAVTPEQFAECPVVLNPLEIQEIYRTVARGLNYSAVYAHTNLYAKGDQIQKDPTGDALGITMTGEAAGCVRSTKFDADGMTLGSIRIVEQGKAVNYYGSNRFGQYLGEKPTGMLSCLCADAGTVKPEQYYCQPCLEVVSMSGLQVDDYNDYIGGEVRLAYYHADGKVLPVTGISISGKLSQVLSSLRLAEKTTVHGGYIGPEKAILTGMKIF